VRSRSATALAFAVLMGVVVASGALGSTGDLLPRGCVENESPAGPDACAQSSDWLRLPQDVAVSPDGRSVYVAAIGDDTIVRFKRNRNTGSLQPKGCIGNTGTSGCPRTATGLDGAHSVVVSADGRSVYVAAAEFGSVVRLKRNRKTGALKPGGCIDDAAPPDVCARDAHGLDGANDVAVSRDGKSVYAGTTGAVVRFTRKPRTGALRPRGCVADNDTGPGACAQSTNGLYFVYGVAVSPDGRSVYAAAYEDDALVRFARNTKTGALKPRGCVDDNDDGPDQCAQSMDGLEGAISLDVSPDGKSVYVAASSDDAVARLKRNRETGALNPAGCTDDDDTGPDSCASTSPGLAGATSVAVTRDGRSVYVAARDDDAVAHLRRSRETGALTTAGCVDDNDSGPDGCDRDADGLNYLQALAPSPDSRSVYAVSYLDEAIAHLKRRR
jgi:fibronectin-binding autotransporter adhesin